MAFRDEALPHDSIVIAATGGRVVGLDRRTGEQRWAADLDSRGAVYVAFRYGALVVSSYVDEIHRLDPLTGARLWLAKTSSRGRAAIVVEPDCIVCAKGDHVDYFDHAGYRMWSQRVVGHDENPITVAVTGNVAQADEVVRPRPSDVV